jgi:hypothetical protein
MRTTYSADRFRRVMMVVAYSLVFSMIRLVHADNDMQVDMKRNRLMDFTAHLRECANPHVLKRLSMDDTSRVVEYSKWEKRPLEANAVVSNGTLRVRVEEDFMIFWLHGNGTVKHEEGDPFRIVRRVTENVLSKVFVLGDTGTLAYSNASATAKTEIRVTEMARKSAVTGAITCTFTRVSGKQRTWNLIDSVYVLVKGNDELVVMEKLKARSLGVDEYTYEGLEAAKAGTATNVILSAGSTVDVPLPLLNGCMWPVDRHVGSNVKDLGPAREQFRYSDRDPK